MAQPPGTPYGPRPPGAFPPPPPPPAPRGPGRLLVVLSTVAAVVLLLIASVAGYLLLRDGDADAEISGPADLRQPLVFQQVEAVTRPPCAAGTLPDTKGTSCYRAASGGMSVTHVKDIRVAAPDAATGQTQWGVLLKLDTADAAGFARLSGQAAQNPQGSPSRQIAMVTGGTVLAAPEIAGGPITGGALTISGRFTQAEVRDLIRRMTGRETS
ncbi:hypothetical protein AGRA3207_006994 [Actinomadura graeca]|uniref:SecDF P1 head subdomain domain-containing protein n=1 Tax=Actinomadura graeca TaxID=2750812 RepID=A0ABX8R5E6_9ACTN|nr:hypothetical protein [Actinomadura graeca]QXJ25494.1 hypothetical protein AGRA3207_006994 [Actinomadura graeca]